MPEENISHIFFLYEDLRLRLSLILTVDTGAVVVESGHGGARHADVQDDHLRSYKVEDVNINVT